MLEHETEDLKEKETARSCCVELKLAKRPQFHKRRWHSITDFSCPTKSITCNN